MPQLDNWNAFLTTITIPATSKNFDAEAEQTALNQFEFEYRESSQEHTKLIEKCARPVWDFSLPAEDHRRVAEHLTAWIERCAAWSPAACGLAGAGLPGLSLRLELARTDAIKSLQILGEMSKGSSDAAALIASGIAAARSDAISTIGRLSGELSRETDPLNRAGHLRHS